MSKPVKGYIMLDILLGLFLFSIGFAVVWGLNTSSVFKSAQMEKSLQAINLAASTIDELHTVFKQDRARISNYTSLDVEDKQGAFYRVIRAEWVSKDLLLLAVEVRWTDRSTEKQYYLESYYYAEPFDE